MSVLSRIRSLLATASFTDEQALRIQNNFKN